MKKRTIALLISMLLVILSLTACSSETTTISMEKTQPVIGSYFLYKTEDVQEYLSFLEDFDETKYEILDISTSMKTTGYGSDDFYMVTYKLLSETK